MNKLALCLVIIAALMLENALADFWYNHVNPQTQQEIAALGLKCTPGRTTIKVSSKASLPNSHGHGINDELDENSDEDNLRSHTHWVGIKKDESCQVCICSDDGKTNKCIVRPAMNVNECIRLAELEKEWKSGAPFEHVRNLAQMVRRGDLIWHKDEIPYGPGTKCPRGTSYYTNDKEWEKSRINKDSDIESMLSYPDRDLCYFCTCSISGLDIGCIERSAWFCSYYRTLSQDQNTIKDMYAGLFGINAVPDFYRSLSWRLRRRMDEGLFIILDIALSKLLPGIKSSAGAKECVPFVSEYSDCTEENQCSGCTRCSCSASAQWVCEKVIECPKKYTPVSDSSINSALEALLYELKNKKNNVLQSKIILPPVKAPTQEQLLEEEIILDPTAELERKIAELVNREKRSAKGTLTEALADTPDEPHNGTVTFYNIVDELNEDTLKNSNASGTIQASKVAMKNLLSRRTNPILKSNATENPLQIEYNDYHRNIDNKIDGNRTDDAFDLGVIVANHTQQEKDKELSKIIVNELKSGSELIGDKNGPIMSNITFTPENDTLTAMAFIAGNLLNKLWSMEKDGSDESLEIDAMKSEKLNDLLELFKDPLTIRQELFLKNALETLSRAIDKSKNGENISLCQSIEEAKKYLNEAETAAWERSDVVEEPEILIRPNEKTVYHTSNGSLDALKPLLDQEKRNKKNATVKAFSKISGVLNLVKKYEILSKHLNTLKRNNLKKNSTKSLLKSVNFEENLSDTEYESLNMFGKVLAKITKLLLPYKASKKIVKKIKSINALNDEEENMKEKYKNMFNIDLTNTSLAAKDKFMLDYLTRINSNPRIFSEDNLSTESLIRPLPEGNLTLNLSEFLKVKSYMDLIKQLDGNKKGEGLQSLRGLSAQIPTTRKAFPTEKVSELELAENDYFEISSTTPQPTTTTQKSQRVSSVQDRLKDHLKTILNDLLELQKESGIPGKRGQIQIAEALPCIYNVLTADNEVATASMLSPEEKDFDPYEKLAEVFADMRQELNQINETAKTRRFNKDEFSKMLAQTPQSALIWERMVKNMDKMNRRTFRRNDDIKTPIPYEELQAKTDDMEKTVSHLRLYNNASDLVPAEQLKYLKLLHADVQRHRLILKDIKTSLEIIQSLPKDKRVNIEDFVISSLGHLELVNKRFKEYEVNSNFKKYIEPQTTDLMMDSGKEPPPVVMPIPATRFSVMNNELKEEPSESAKKIQLTRDDILNHLIRNRVTQFMKKEESSNTKHETDPIYNIAKNILISIDNKQPKVAKQLYKVFVAVNNKKEHKALRTLDIDSEATTVISSTTTRNPGVVVTVPNNLAHLRRGSIYDKMPLVHFEDTRPIGNQLIAARRDQMLKNLLSSKNFRTV